LRQVYDDKKVLVLSGGVMLGRPDQPQTPFTPAWSPMSPFGPPMTPLHIVPVPAVPPLYSSASSSFSSGEYLPTPIDSYEPTTFVAAPPPPTQWTFAVSPKQTTITVKLARPPTSHLRHKKERQAQPAPSDRPFPPPWEADIASKLSSLHLEPSVAQTDGYASDDGINAGNRADSPPAAPFRRSSLGAVVGLDEKRKDVSDVILRERRASQSHRRGPSM